MVKHILVGVDGSQGALAAAHYARDLARQCGAHLTLLLVLEAPQAMSLLPFDGLLVTNARPDPEHIAAAKAHMEAITKELPPGQTTVTVRVGAAVETVLAEGRSQQADLLVVGARGLGAAARLVLGSISERLVTHADRPVLVVR